MACLRVAEQRGIEDPYRIAKLGKAWTREQWGDVQDAYKLRAQERARAAYEARSEELDAYLE